MLEENNFNFSAICLQECWLPDNYDLSLLQIKGYNCIYQNKSSGNKGGLVIYLRDISKYKVKLNFNTSNIWEGLFIEITGDSLKKKVIFGNLYRPPNNILANYRQFIEELNTQIENAITLLTRFSTSNCTLIDNIFCKLSQVTIKSIAGILINQFSDHHPYFLFLDLSKHRNICPKTVKIYTKTEKNNIWLFQWSSHITNK